MSVIYLSFKNLWYNQVNKPNLYAAGDEGMQKATLLIGLAAFFLLVRLLIQATVEVEKIAVNFERRLTDAEATIYRLEAVCEKAGEIP